MGKGHFTGGSTIIRPGSDWFSYSAPPAKKPRTPKAAGTSMKDKIAEAAESLAQAKAEYDAGLWKGVPGRKKAKKQKRQAAAENPPKEK